MTEIDHIVQIDHETTTEMTIKTGIKAIIETGMKTDMRTIIKISIKTDTKMDIETSTEITTYMIALTEVEISLGKDIAHITLEKIMVLLVTIQGLKDFTKSCNS